MIILAASYLGSSSLGAQSHVGQMTLELRLLQLSLIERPFRIQRILRHITLRLYLQEMLFPI